MDKVTYFLVFDGKVMPRWCTGHRDESGALVWIDFKGRRMGDAAVSLIAHVEGETPEATLRGIEPELARLVKDFAYEFLLEPRSDQGWIAPNGRFYGCRFFAHDDLAMGLLRKSPAQLEGEGFIRVHADSFRFEDFRGRGMTNAQAKTLAALGFDETPGSRRVGYVRLEDSDPVPSFAHVAPEDWTPPSVRFLPTVPRPPAAHAPKAAWDAALPALIARLDAIPAMAALLATGGERVRDTGGRWKWLLHHDEIDVGSEEDLAYLVKSPGLGLIATAFDQIEIVAWPSPGIHTCPEVDLMLADRAPSTEPRMHHA